MKVKANLFFKYDIEGYKAGYAYRLEMEQFRIERLLRKGCIYAPKDAKYYEEPKAVEEPKKKPIEEPKEEPAKEEIKDVDHKDIEQAKVQTKRTNKRKLKK